ncbi:MAG: hypothetical protein M3N15_07250, partial [Actinomycetota bacterium]|nr:hypothetical protein [Actinomycetota bacterium]
MLHVVLLLASAIAMMLALGAGTAFADQSASVSNTGRASADTGGNVAIGNASDNEASNDQDADAHGGRHGDAIATNDGAAENTSDGTATIETGDARAAGVVANTAVNQEAEGRNADQSARVRNNGRAHADTGDNLAIGNVSDNEASNDQDADARGGRRGDAIASNFGEASNDSDGTATIETGDAEAAGVLAHTAINQEATDDGGRRWRGGGGSDQSVRVSNTGRASADTGDNVAIGNASDNEASNDQDADVRIGDRDRDRDRDRHCKRDRDRDRDCKRDRDRDRDCKRDRDRDRDGRGGVAVAANFGGAFNESDGTAVIETGDARAAGVVAATFINQDSETDGCCRRFGGDSDQSARVTNRG